MTEFESLDYRKKYEDVEDEVKTNEAELYRRGRSWRKCISLELQCWKPLCQFVKIKMITTKARFIFLLVSSISSSQEKSFSKPRSSGDDNIREVEVVQQWCQASTKRLG